MAEQVQRSALTGQQRARRAGHGQNDLAALHEVAVAGPGEDLQVAGGGHVQYRLGDRQAGQHAFTAHHEVGHRPRIRRDRCHRGHVTTGRVLRQGAHGNPSHIARVQPRLQQLGSDLFGQIHRMS